MKIVIHALSVSALISVASLSGCAKNSNTNTSRGSTGILAGKVGGKTSTTGSGTTGEVLCKNPINLEESSFTLIREVKDFPIGLYEMSEISMYESNEETGDSFEVSADSTDDFNGVTLACNGVHAPQDSNSRSEITSSTRASSYLNTETMIKAEYQRELEVEFENGQMTSARSILRPDSPNKSNLATLPLDRIQIGDNTYVTIRMYRHDDLIDVRLQYDYVLSSGKVNHKFTKVLYKKKN